MLYRCKGEANIAPANQLYACSILVLLYAIPAAIAVPVPELKNINSHTESGLFFGTLCGVRV